MLYRVTGQLLTPQNDLVPVDQWTNAEGIFAAAEAALWAVCVRERLNTVAVEWYGAPVVEELENDRVYHSRCDSGPVFAGGVSRRKGY